jgi:hypothetical protein
MSADDGFKAPPRILKQEPDSQKIPTDEVTGHANCKEQPEHSNNALAALLGFDSDSSSDEETANDHSRKDGAKHASANGDALQEPPANDIDKEVLHDFSDIKVVMELKLNLFFVQSIRCDHSFV